MSAAIDPKRLADNYKPQFGMPWVPIHPVDRLNAMTDRELWEYHNARKTMDQLMAVNPIAAGWTLPAWQGVLDRWQEYPIHVILGGVRSSKSQFCARLCVWLLGNIPEAEIRCYHVSQDRSREDQQKVIYESLPLGLKNIPVKKGPAHSISYNQRTGFTNDQLILPPLEGYHRGGRIDFGNYRQYMADPKVTEGYRAHGVWGDEEMPVKMFETLTYRTSDFHGRVILSFTTLEGYTPLVQDILGKTRTIESRYSELVGRKLPTVQESLSREGCCIHYFWTLDNPFIDGEEFKKKLRGRSKIEILARAHGIPVKSAEAVFSLFDPTVGTGNVIKHEDLPFVKNPAYPCTRYVAIDPAGSKAWFITWVAVDAAGTWWVYREWPDAQHDVWALPGSTSEGKPGPAQKAGDDKGIRDYVELMKGSEEGEVIFERVIDPRMGAAERQSEEGATTIISDLDKCDMTVIPAPGVDIENGLQLLRGLLAWKPDKPKDSLNSPKLYVSERCHNVIYALSEYTNCGPHEACKDPIDTLRYLAVSSIAHYSAADMKGVAAERTGTQGLED